MNNPFTFLTAVATGIRGLTRRSMLRVPRESAERGEQGPGEQLKDLIKKDEQ